jgi:hypothetical protein
MAVFVWLAFNWGVNWGVNGWLVNGFRLRCEQLGGGCGWYGVSKEVRLAEEE